MDSQNAFETKSKSFEQRRIEFLMKKTCSLMSIGLTQEQIISTQNGRKKPQQLLRSHSSLSLLLRTPQTELIGCRVVRGPNWRWGKQDGYYKKNYFSFFKKLP